MSGRALALLIFIVGPVFAQINRTFPGQGLAGRVKVHIAFPDRGPCDQSTRVTLTSDSGTPVAEGTANGECLVEFSHIPPGNYQVSVVGRDIARKETGEVEVGSSDYQDLEVRVRRTVDSSPLPAGALISAADLGIPAGAAKEFDKALRLIAHEDWNQALEHLRKAVTIYPSYASAYNDLGVVYTRLGDRVHGREALQKAISLNDHLAPAYVNLSRISIGADDFPEADALLNKALSLAPSDATTFILLSYVQVREGQMDAAIATSQRAHALPEGRHAFVHLGAAHAFEQKHKISDAIAELRLFLAEDPGSPQAAEVRNAITKLESSPAEGGGKS